MLRKVRHTRLTLLDRVSFASSTLHFGPFKIQKFTKDELDELIDHDIRQVFYPERQLNTELACQYWYIVEDPITDGDDGSGMRSTVERTLPERAIQLLSFSD